MKIKNSVTTKSEANTGNTESLSDLIESIEEKYRDYFIDKVDNEVFIYTPLGRKDWIDICERTDLNQFKKEELICSLCTIYPKNYDFTECLAGIPTELSKLIIEHSYLTKDDMINMIAFYRNEMNTINNNITCLINEAFPNYDIEEIENWGMDKTIKYFTRAEWKLTNLRGLPLKEDIITLLQQSNGSTASNDNTNVKSADTAEIADSGANLSPERLAELKAKFPDIDWGNPTTHLR